MALTYDQLTAITQKKFLPKLVDNVFDSDPLLKRFKEKGSYESVNGGERIVQPLIYAQTTSSGWYSGADTLATADNDQMTAAEYTWKQAYANISITGRDEMINHGDSAIVNLVKSKVMIAEKTLIDKLGDGIYSAGTDAKSIVGLRSILSTSNTIGGISQTTYSWWAAQVDSSTTTFSLSAMQTLYNLCSINNEGPSVITATRANYNRFYGVLQPQQRFVDSDSAKAGFSSLMFNGTPFIVSSKCPTAHILMLNEQYLKLWYHPSRDFALEPFQKVIGQDAKNAKVLWMGALGSTNNRMHGIMSAVAA